MESNSFDKFIKGKLEGLEASYDPSHWEMMEHQMMNDAGPEGEARDPQSIDDIVGEKLRNIEVNFSSNHWHLMSEQLDAELSPEIDDVFLDGLAYENLNGLTSPYNPDHWALMSRRLDKVFSIRYNVKRYKLVEAIFFLLLIFSLLPYIPVNNKTKQQPLPEQQGIANLSLIPTTKNQVADAPLNKDTDIEEKSATSNGNAQATQISNQSLIKDVVSKTNNDEAIIPLLIEENSIPAEEKSFKAFPPIISTPQLSISNITGEHEHKYALNSDRSVFPPFNMLENKLALLEAEIEPTQFIGGFHLLQPKATSIRLGMAASFDINNVLTPFNQELNIDAYNGIFLGYGGGLTLGFGRDKWEVELGALYSSISYLTDFNVSVGGSLSGGGFSGEGLKAATLEVVKIPVNVHRSLGKIGKWHTSVLFGASANTIIFSQYEVKKVTVGSNPNPSPTPIGFSTPAETYKGFFQGGSLRENTYITANIGFRLERDLSERWSLFLQPVYQHHPFSKSFGPDDNRFNSGSILFGMRANLKR